MSGKPVDRADHFRDQPGMATFELQHKKQAIGKSANFSGKPILSQLLYFIDKSELEK